MIFQDKKASFVLEVKKLTNSEEFIDEFGRIHAEVFSIFFRKDVRDQLCKSIQRTSWLLVISILLLILQIFSEKHEEIMIRKSE